MTEQEKIKVNQLIVLLKLYLERENLEAGFPISQLHSKLRDVFNMVHYEILGAVLPQDQIERMKQLSEE